MKKVDYSNVEAAADRLSQLAEFDADALFPGLLSSDEMEQIQRRRVKAKPTGKVKEIKEDEYIIHNGGFDANTFAPVDDFDIGRYMAEAEDKETGTLHDLRIDTRDLRAAKNFYDFAFNMMGKEANPPWSRQLWIASMIYGEVCPVCSNKEWLDIRNVPKHYRSVDAPEHLTFLEFGKCPKCKREKWDLIKNHGLNNYIQYCGVIGQRGSKSSLTALCMAYGLHRFLKFPNYASLTKSMQASTELTATMVSLTFAKAVGVLWTPFKKIIETECQWFKDYWECLDQHGNKIGRELYKLSSLYLTVGYKNIRYYPSGPKSSTLRGDTRIAGALDELGLFPLPTGDSEEDDTSERANADEAHKSLYNSMGTVSVAYETLLKEGYSSAPPPILYNVSSPYSMRDKMMRLLKESKTPDGKRTILGLQLATWEINPFYERDSAFIAAAYAANPEKAERDFGANPPAVHSRFIHPDTIKDGIFVNGQNSHNFVYQWDRPGEVYGRIEKIRSYKWPSIVAIDAGHKNNSFSVVAGHYDFDTGKTVVSTVLECMANGDTAVNFNLIYLNVILKLAKEMHAVGLAADQWQGIDLLYRIKEDMGNNPLGKPRCLPKQYSPRRKDFDAVLALLQAKNLLLPTLGPEALGKIFAGDIENYKTELMGKPVDHLALQMITVRNMHEERPPEKGEGLTDDIFRAITLLVATIHHPRVMDRLVEARKFNYGGSSSMPEPVFMSRSGFGSIRRFGTR